MSKLQLDNLYAASLKTGSKAQTEQGMLRALRQARLAKQYKDEHKPTHEVHIPTALVKLKNLSCSCMPKPPKIKNWYSYSPQLHTTPNLGSGYTGHGNTGGRYRRGDRAEWYPVYFLGEHNGVLRLVTHDKNISLPVWLVPITPSRGKGERSQLRAMQLVAQKHGLTAGRIEGGLAYIHPTLGHYHPRVTDPKHKVMFHNGLAEAQEAYKIRAEKLRTTEIKLGKLQNIWVTEQDSLDAGNCEPITRKVVVLAQRKYGRFVAIRADILLGLRDDAYSNRSVQEAIRKRNIRLGISAKIN